MGTDAQTQAIPRVPVGHSPGPGKKGGIAEPDAGTAGPGPDAEVAAAPRDGEVAAPGPDAVVTREESTDDLYAAGLAKLEALHDRWVAAVAEIREAQVIGGPGRAAA